MSVILQGQITTFLDDIGVTQEQLDHLREVFDKEFPDSTFSMKIIQGDLYFVVDQESEIHWIDRFEKACDLWNTVNVSSDLCLAFI